MRKRLQLDYSPAAAEELKLKRKRRSEEAVAEKL